MIVQLFIDEQYLKDKTPIGGLVEWSTLESTVATSQDVYIQDILGTNFYNHLLGVYIAGTQNANETTLLSKIRVALAFRTAEQVAPFINFDITNKGIMTESGDYAQSTDLDGVRYIRTELKNRAEFYETRITAYLRENNTLFPQYITDNSTDMSPSTDANYNFGGLEFWF